MKVSFYFKLKGMREMMSLEQLMNEHAHILNENDEYILKFIVQNMKTCMEKTVAEIAQLANVSDSTIIRMTKKLGFNGYGEFRYYLKEAHAKEQQTQVHSSDFFLPSVLLEDVASTTKLFENERKITDVYQKIYSARKIFAYATGHGQGLMLQEFARCMWNAGIYIIIVPETKELELISKDITQEDLLIIISLSGKTDKISTVLKKIQLSRTPILSVTRFGQNQLASLADVSLYYQ